MNINDKLCLADRTTKINEYFYRSIVGGLMYFNSYFSVSLISKFMHSPFVHHLRVAKRILQYVCGTIIMKFYINIDWVNSIDDKKSTSGFVFSFGSGVISWISKKQESTALSSSEAEYITAPLAAQQTI
ncbi:unnamed protein product [Spirodela intermedia]|uniref:Uncharacterized protein n=1 Tax=Spirodela intermedia TaxID=51605 RepID=A0A7I8LIZ7_SPIIN|nr:unnamed protein product [Spirodela intermedia]